MARIKCNVRLPVFSIAIITIILTLGFIFVMSDSIPVTAHGLWQQIVPDSVNVASQGNNLTVLSLTAADSIPHNERVIFGGFGWMYVGGNSALVVTSHYGVQDSVQNPDHWHVHNLTFESVGGGSFTHCITGLTNDDTAGIPINGDDIRVVIKNNKFDGTLNDPPIAISFDIMPDPLKYDCASGFGLGIHTTEPAPSVAEEGGPGNSGGGQGGGKLKP